MKKERLLCWLAYGIPWAFLALYADAVYGWGWHYLLIFICMAVIAWIGMKSAKMFLLGNLLSLGSSLLCTYWLGFVESSYFKPFGAFGWVVLLSAASALVQWLVRKREWLVLGLFTAVAGMLIGGAYWLQISM